MGKLTVSLSDETERRLREYVSTKYPLRPFGKISDIVEEALIQYLPVEGHPR